MTEMQSKILQVIRTYIKEEGFPPTIREIANEVGLKSTSTVHGYLDRLEKKGYIKRKPTSPRGLKIIEENILN